ncbi:MAG: DUF523 and DUF1722 domain-containing protein [Nitrospirae bacterium]|jgi:uncharacterized protein YbgA (DUF1722 family)/uncharacterized protein YbbK (DUF523 family)|nr:DUF523 and DUF1722 domain-containing protein [Nitrospirota bacterium]
MEKIKIGVSSCLLGEKVRYDGGHKHDRYITDTLGNFFEYIPVCPEVECGLPVPREAMHLVGDHKSPRLITIRTGIDHTEKMLKWIEKKLIRLGEENLCGFIFKSRSPSSGIKDVKIYSSSGMPSGKGAGLFGGAFIRTFPNIPVIDEGRLHDPVLRENFIERVFIFYKWQKLLEDSYNLKGLINFHTKHKLIIMSHSQKHLSLLGKLVADAKTKSKDNLFSEYINLLTEAMKLIATVKKNTNVLQHIAGYFKNNLSHDDKQELSEIINNYHKGFIPLIVPVTLLNHYTRKFNISYLKDQAYLNPHPLELMLRNHV